MAEDKPVKVQAARSAGELAQGTFSPLVDVYETDKELVMVAEVPGAAPEQVAVKVDKGVLTVEAEARFEVPGEEYARTFVGFEPGQYFRAFALSDEIDRERITASVANGVLTIRLPKAETAKTRKIEVKAGK